MQTLKLQMLPIRPEKVNIVSNMTWNIQICQGTQEKWVQRSFFSYCNIYSSRNNYHRPQSPFVLRTHTLHSLLSFPGHEHGKGLHMSLLYKPNSLLSPSRPLANRTLWEIRFLECVLTQNFDIRSKYSSTRDRCPDSEAASESVSCLHICVRGRKTSSLLAFPRQVEEVLTQTFSHRLINLCSFPALTSTWRHPHTTGPLAKAIKTQMHFVWTFLRQF